MKAGHDQTQIAKLLDRHKSIISRELIRITGSRGYRPKQAFGFSAESAQDSWNAPAVEPRERLGLKTPAEVFQQSLKRVALRS